MHHRLPALAAVAFAVATPALADPGVRVENAAARMVVIPEARGDVRVDVQPGDPRLPTPAARREGDQIVVDGGLADRIGSCGAIGVSLFSRSGSAPSGQRVFIRGVGPLTLDRLPLITAHVPLRASVSAKSAVFGRVGPSERLALANAGCGDWTVADVRGDLAVASAGSGDIGAGRAGALHAALSGSGDLTAGEVAGAADVAVHGSADTKIDRVGGALTLDVAGSGDVRVREVAGVLRSRQSGSGEVAIAGGRVPSLQANASGSGDFHFGGTAGAVAVAAAGSGDVTVAHATGPVSESHAGSGEIHVGR